MDLSEHQGVPISEVFDCRFCHWKCNLKKNNFTAYMNTIRRHLKTKHAIILRQHDIVMLVKKFIGGEIKKCLT
jgi:hypothetical protein